MSKKLSEIISEFGMRELEIEMKLRMKVFLSRWFYTSRFGRQLKILLFLIPILFLMCPVVHGMAADCALEPTGENYIGIRYKALLVEDELSESGWVLLFGGNGFTMNGEYQGHFVNLMIKAGWADIWDDGSCADGFVIPKATLSRFTIAIGLDDYEDTFHGWIHDNDIAIWSRDPELLPRRFSNIDSREPKAPDYAAVEYQVNKGGTLEGREIEVSLVRAEVTRLPKDKNYFMDPDLEGEQLCKPCSQDDILYRHWIATLKVPSLGINSSVDIYINASQGDKINGNNTLNFMWENPGRPVIESDKYKVIIFDPEVKTVSGEWKKATRFLVDLRTPEDELPFNEKGELVGGYRKVNYKGCPAIEASFGYGYTDYVIDGDPTNYEPNDTTKAVIDLRYPEGNESAKIKVVVKDSSGSKIEGASICVDDLYKGITDYNGEYTILNLFPGYHIIEASKSEYESVSTMVYVESDEMKNVTLILQELPTSTPIPTPTLTQTPALTPTPTSTLTSTPTLAPTTSIPAFHILAIVALLVATYLLRRRK